MLAHTETEAMSRKKHWNEVYQTKTPDDVSWYQRRPELSLELIAASDSDKDSGIIDVGAELPCLSIAYWTPVTTDLPCSTFRQSH
jgi:hypothetical protein